MRKGVKIFIIVISIILIVNLIYFITFYLSSNRYFYNKIEGEDDKYKYLFNDTIRDKLNYVNSFGNETENYYVYDLISEIQCFIMDVEGLVDTEVADIEMFEDSNFEEIKMNPKHHSYIGSRNFSLITKTTDLKFSKLKIHVNEKFKLLYNNRYNNYYLIHMNSKGFALSDSLHDYKLKLANNKSFESILIFLHEEKNSKFLVLFLFFKQGINKSFNKAEYESWIKNAR
jgi:hypothetical protein